jgi:hypothetical protein
MRDKIRKKFLEGLKIKVDIFKEPKTYLTEFNTITNIVLYRHLTLLEKTIAATELANAHKTIGHKFQKLPIEYLTVNRVTTEI